MTLLQSNWTAFLAGTVAYVLSMALSWQTPSNLASLCHQPTSNQAGIEAGPSWSFVNPELDQLIADLKKEKESFVARETELRKWESRLQVERTELNQLTQTVFRLQQEFDKNVVRVHEDEAINLRRLARTYSGMEPESAAAIFKQMEDPSIIKILLYMKETDTAAVFQALAKMGEAEAKRTATLSDRLRQSINNAKAAKSAFP